MDKTSRRGRGREWVAIVNPASRGGSTSKNLSKLETALRAGLGNDLEFVVARGPGDSSVAIRDALRTSAGTVIAVGGDGTANGVANAFMRERESTGSGAASSRKTRTRMGLIPAGTRNVLAKSLGLPADLSEAIDRLRTSRGRPLDVIRATSTPPTEGGTSGPSLRGSTGKEARFVLNAAEVGVGATLSERSKKIRSVLNVRPLATAASALYTVPTYRSAMCLMSLDGREERLIPKLTMCVIANGRMIGGGLEAAPLADPSDGCLDVTVLEESGSLKLLGKLLKMRTNGDIEERDVFYSRARRVSLRPCEDRIVTVTVDGEPAGSLPASFEILPAALLFRY